MRAEQTKFAVTDDGNARIVRDLCALENATGRGEWFGEHRALIRNFIGHRQQVRDW